MKYIDRDAPKSGLASLMAMKGRYGDNNLVHMSDEEINALQNMGQLTVNPDTGLPEAFSLGQILPMVANIGLGIATGGMSLPAQMAIMAASNAAMTKIAGGSTEDALLSGVLGGAGAGIGGMMSGAGEAAKAGAGATGGAGMSGAQSAAAGGFGNSAGEFGRLGTSTMSEGAKSAAKSGFGAGQLGEFAGMPMTGTQFGTQAAGEFGGAAGKQSIAEATKAGSASMTPQSEGIISSGMREVGLNPDAQVHGGWEGLGKEGWFKSAPVTTGEAVSKGMTTGALSALQMMASQEPPEAAELQQRVPAESSYGTRAAEEIKQNYQPQGLSAEEVQRKIEGSGGLDFFAPQSASAPITQGGSGVTGAPSNMMGGSQLAGTQYAAKGGSVGSDALLNIYLANGGDVGTFRGLVQDGGEGDGMSDNVEFDVVGDPEINKAMLSPDEYVIDAATVAALGNGSTNAGAKKLDEFTKNLRHSVYEKGKQPKENAGLQELLRLQS